MIAKIFFLTLVCNGGALRFKSQEKAEVLPTVRAALHRSPSIAKSIVKNKSIAMDESPTKDALLVVYLAHPKAYLRTAWFQSLYEGYFRDIVYYGDSNWCHQQFPARACKGPANSDNPTVQAALQNATNYTWIFNSLEVDGLKIRFVPLGGGWYMQRALLDAIAHAEPKKYTGFFFMTDDGVVQPWNMGKMDPTKFWISPLWQAREKYKIANQNLLEGPQCGFAQGHTWVPCKIEEQSSMVKQLAPSGLSDMDATIFKPKLRKEMEPWHAGVAQQFCMKLDGKIKKKWDQMWQLNTDMVNDDTTNNCPVLQSAQNDMNYVPASHVKEWVPLVQLMDSAGMYFHHIFATAAVGLVPTEDIQVLLTHYSAEPCLQQLEAHSHWHGIHPCKSAHNSILDAKIESLFRMHRANSFAPTGASSSSSSDIASSDPVTPSSDLSFWSKAPNKINK